MGFSVISFCQIGIAPFIVSSCAVSMQGVSSLERFETWMVECNVSSGVTKLGTPEKDIRISGYVAKEELLGNKALMIWMKKGKGQFVLFGFNPNFRASTHATYKLLFNSILLPE